jgi:hypothetical protein
MAKHYNRKFINSIINPLKKNGFSCERNKNTGYCISRDGGEKIMVHSGMSCYHELRRALKSVYNFNLEEY